MMAQTSSSSRRLLRRLLLLPLRSAPTRPMNELSQGSDLSFFLRLACAFSASYLFCCLREQSSFFHFLRDERAPKLADDYFDYDYDYDDEPLL